MAQPNYRTETDILRRVACSPSCRWFWSKHWGKRENERSFSAPDVQNVLMKGHVELVERKADDVWRVQGRDLDGNRLTVACVVFEDSIAIRVVTAF